MGHHNVSFTEKQILDVLIHSENATAIYSSEDMIIVSANNAMIRLWGKDSSVIGKSIAEALPELKDQPFKQIYDDVMRTGVTYASDNMPAQLMVDGVLRDYYFDFKYAAINDAEGKTYCVLNTATDVTDRYLAQLAMQRAEEREHDLNEELAASNEELAAMNEELSVMNEELLVSSNSIQVLNDYLSLSERELNFAIDAAELGTFDLDPATGKFSGNERLKSWFGLQSEESIELGKATDVIVDKDRPRVIAAIAHAMNFASGGDYNIEYSIQYDPDQDPRLVRAKGKALFNEAQQATRFSGTLQDITEEEKTRLALADSAAGLQLALDAAELGSYDLDLATGDMICSAQCLKNFGRAHHEKFNMSDLLASIHDEYREYVKAQIEKAINSKGVYQAEYITVWPDGTEHWIRAFGKPHYDYSGQPFKITGVTYDITEQKKDELRKNDFIGMVSHELKTPLTSLKAYLQLMKLRLKQSEGGTSELLLKAEIQSNKMISMINGFLNISRLESGQIFLQQSEFYLNELIKEIIEEQKLLYSGHQIVLHECDELKVHADREKIGHVISNLVSNAAKYSTTGSVIEVSCGFSKDTVSLSVKDEGIGIRLEDSKRIFERYYRVENSKNIVGFGIGLYLSAEIIHRHGGEIGVESSMDERPGSIFWFTLPL